MAGKSAISLHIATTMPRAPRPRVSGEPDRKRSRPDDNWESWRVKELREQCRIHSLASQGRKAELIDRLREAGVSPGLEEEDESSSLSMPLSPISSPSSSPRHTPPSPPLHRLTVAQLRQRCRALGIPSQGRKAQLVQRIESASSPLQEEEEEEGGSEPQEGEGEGEEGHTDGFLDSTSADSSTCLHVTLENIQRRKVQRTALNPVHWKCQTCDTTESVWICLTCAHVGCGRQVHGHAHQHARESGHALLMDINSTLAFCYPCNQEIEQDTDAQDIGQLRQCLHRLQTHPEDIQEPSSEAITEAELSLDMDSSVDGPLPRAKLRRRASQFVMRPLDHDIEDCFITSQTHYRNNVLARPFHTWQRFVDRCRMQRLTQSLEEEGEEEGEEEEGNSFSSLELSGISEEAPSPSEKSDFSTSESSQTSRPPGALPWLSRTKTLELSRSFSLDENNKQNVSRFRPRARGNPTDGTPDPKSQALASSSSPPQEEKTKPIVRTPRLPGLSRTASSSVLITPGQTGLRNLGNSCFMNAVIQALSSLVELRRFLIRDLLPQGRSVPLANQMITRTDTKDCLALVHNSKLVRTLEEKEISVCLELHRLMRVIWSGKNAVITPHSLFFAMWKLKPSFQGYQQQDAEELLSFFMDKVDEELRESSARARRSSLHFPSIMEKLCQGVLATRITCAHCQHVLRRTEPFRQLCWPIPPEFVTLRRPARRAKTPTPTCPLDALAQAWQAPEALPGYRCENCGDTEHGSKQVMVEEAPDILCVVINRFAWSGRGRSKVNTIVSYPLEFELPLLSPPSVSYTLRSVVRHHGYTLNSGHYTATVYNTIKGQWLDCNDHVVKPLDPSQVIPADNSAYILFYTRREGEWP